MESLLRYYGLDWAGMVFAFVSLYYIGKQRKRGFLIGIGGNIAWLGFAILAESLANLLANIIYIALNCRGFWKWKHEKTASGSPTDEG
jgi:nicotinamide riboside transporter PnuC